MSQVLRDAIDLLRRVVEKIDARRAELQAEDATLANRRGQLVAIIDGDAVLSSSEVPDAVAAPTPAARPVQPPASSSAKATDADAAARVLKVLREAGEPLRYPQLERASKLSPWGARLLIRHLLDDRSIERTGKTNACRYSLPTGRGKRSASAAPGTGKPADDDGHGASVLDISAGEPAGMSDSPQDAIIQAPSHSRPPASSRASHANAESGTPRAGQEDDRPHSERDEDPQSEGAGDSDDSPDGALGAVDDADDELDADLDLADEADHDLDAAQAELDEEPTYRKRPGPKPKYKPGHRQLPATGEKAAPSTSWWLRPDADFAAEAERMRLNPKTPKTPGENNIICMNGAF
jgi:hypothetical protein